jgi:hypothetical protein
MKSNYIKHILLILIFSLVFNFDKKQQNFIENRELWAWASSKKVGATNVSTKVTTDNGVITEIVSKKDEETIVIETYETYPHASYVTILTINKNGVRSIACGGW